MIDRIPTRHPTEHCRGRLAVEYQTAYVQSASLGVWARRPITRVVHGDMSRQGGSMGSETAGQSAGQGRLTQ